LNCLISCKSIEYIYPDIPAPPDRECPEYPTVNFTAIDENNLLISLDDSKLLYKYIIDLQEYAFLLEADKLYYKDVTDFQ